MNMRYSDKRANYNSFLIRRSIYMYNFFIGYMDKAVNYTELLDNIFL